MEWRWYIQEATQVTSDLNHHFKGLDLSSHRRLCWVGLVVSGCGFFFFCQLSAVWISTVTEETLWYTFASRFFHNLKFYTFCRHREVKIPALPKEQTIAEQRSKAKRGMVITGALISNKCHKKIPRSNILHVSPISLPKPLPIMVMASFSSHNLFLCHVHLVA